MTAPLSGTVEVRGEDLCDIAAALGGLADALDKVYGDTTGDSFVWHQLMGAQKQVLRLHPAYDPGDDDQVDAICNELRKPERIKEKEALAAFVRSLGLDEKGGKS